MKLDPKIDTVTGAANHAKQQALEEWEDRRAAAEMSKINRTIRGWKRVQKFGWIVCAGGFLYALFNAMLHKPVIHDNFMMYGDDVATTVTILSIVAYSIPGFLIVIWALWNEQGYYHEGGDV